MPLLRKSTRNYGYFLEEEQVVFDSGHYYVIGKYTKKKRKLTLREKYFGLYQEENRNYYLTINQQFVAILKKISKKHKFKRFQIKFKLFLLQKYL